MTVAKYEVEGPDGSKYEVTMPEGMSPADMQRALSDHFAKLGITATPKPQERSFATPAVQPKFPGLDFSKPVPEVRAAIMALPQEQRKDAFNEWAKDYVTKERAKGGIGQTVNDWVRAAARGTPVGSWIDELTAGTHSMLGLAPYDESKAYQEEWNRQSDEGSTKLGSLPVVGDVHASGLQKLAGGIASAPVTPMVNLMRGTTMLPRMVNAAASGITYGGAYGAGEGNSSGERMMNAATGAAIGGGLGAAAPPIAAGIGRMVTPAARPQGPLANFDRRSVASIADDMQADRMGGLQPGGMYPEGMIADLGPNLQGHVGAIARMPGEGQTIVKDALGATVGQGRRGGAAARINQDINETLGQPQNLVQTERSFVQDANARARPFYQEFERMQMPDTPEIQAITQRVRSVPGVVQEAERLMAAEGVTPIQGTGQYWDYIRRAVDDIADDAPYGSNAKRVFKKLSRDINDTIDTILRRQDAARRGLPEENGVSVYEQARMISGQGQQFRAGIEAGADAFKKGTHPDQMRADLAAMQGRPLERAGFDQGARGALRDMAGTSGTTFGPNGESAMMKQLGNEYARDKLRQVVGEEGANRIVSRLGAEGVYEQTRQAAVGNSVTAAMQQNLKRYGGRTDPQMGSMPDSLWGDAKKAAQSVLNKMTAGYLDERSRIQAVDAARILTAQGPQRDAFIRELTDFIGRRDLTQRQRSAAEALLEVVGAGSRGTAVQATALPGEQRP